MHTHTHTRKLTLYVVRYMTETPKFLAIYVNKTVFYNVITATVALIKIYLMHTYTHTHIAKDLVLDISKTEIEEEPNK